MGCQDVDSTIAYFKQKDHELHIEAMENELAAVQQAISNLMKALEAGIITPTTRTRLLDLEEQQSRLSAKINTAKAEQVKINRDDMIAGLQMFRSGNIKDKKWCCTIKVDIENSKSQYIEKDKQEAMKDGSESTKI